MCVSGNHARLSYPNRPRSVDDLVIVVMVIVVHHSDPRSVTITDRLMHVIMEAG